MTTEKPYTITYSNYFEFEGRILAFKADKLTI